MKYIGLNLSRIKVLWNWALYTSCKSRYNVSCCPEQ